MRAARPNPEAARHGGAARVARPAPPPRSLLRRARPAAARAGRALPEDPPQQSAGLRHRGGLRLGEAAAGAEGVGGAEWGRAEPPRRGAGAAGAGGDGGLRLRPRLPLQRVGGVALPPPADAHPRLPHPPLRGPHGDRAAGGGGLWGAAGGPPLPPGPPRPRHPPAGGQSAHHHPQSAAPGGRQPPSGPHGTTLGGLHRPPAGGGHRPRLHLPPGDGGHPPGSDLRLLGRLQRATAGPGALLRGGPRPPPQGGLRPRPSPPHPRPPPNKGAPPPSPPRLFIFNYGDSLTLPPPMYEVLNGGGSVALHSFPRGDTPPSPPDWLWQLSVTARGSPGSYCPTTASLPEPTRDPTITLDPPQRPPQYPHSPPRPPPRPFNPH